MTDEKIVELFWERSEKAIEETKKLYEKYFHYIAYGILRNDEDSKEIVNDTYLKAWNIIPPQRPKPLKTFLGRITRQLAINRLESNLAKKRYVGQYLLVLDELSECIKDSNQDTDVVESVALRDTLNEFLRSLPLDKRQIFIKRYWYMNSISEIAEDFSISESKVKSLLMRTRKKLKKHLIREGFDI